jgi:hypothetical protein
VAEETIFVCTSASCESSCEDAAGAAEQFPIWETAGINLEAPGGLAAWSLLGLGCLLMLLVLTLPECSMAHVNHAL